MGFKENLIAVLEMERLAGKVSGSMGAPDSGRRIDKEAARRLLERVGYAPRKERDLELFLPVSAEAEAGIVVLDNELPRYRSTSEDIAMRRSPTVKEMLSFRNIKKILSDTDIVESKQQETVRFLYRRYSEQLDLSFTDQDIASLAADGAAALEQHMVDAVVEALDLFAALLDYKKAPRAFALNQHHSIGQVERHASGEIRYGPAVIYSKLHNRLVLIDAATGSRDPEGLERMAAMARGDEAAAFEGKAVFHDLERRVRVRLPDGVFVPPPG